MINHKPHTQLYKRIKCEIVIAIFELRFWRVNSSAPPARFSKRDQRQRDSKRNENDSIRYDTIRFGSILAPPVPEKDAKCR